jgi:hypothetical protein
VELHNHTQIVSAHVADLRQPSISTTAQRVHLFRDQDLSVALLAVGQFCDDNCTAHFNRKSVWIDNVDGHIILHGRRDHTTGLYMVNILSAPTGSTLVTNMVIKFQTQADLVRFGVAAMGSPPTATLNSSSRAVRGRRPAYYASIHHTALPQPKAI